MVVGRGNDEQPVDAPLAEELDELALALGLLVRARGDHQEADVARDLLDAAAIAE